MIKRDEAEIINSLIEVFGRDLTDDEKKEIINTHQNVILGSINFNKAKEEELRIIKELCRLQGYLAENLHDLKSKSGAVFIEQRKSSLHPYKSAVAKKERECEEAYFCGENIDPNSFLGKIISGMNITSYAGCGWVKGRPREEEERSSHYGPPDCVNYYCKVCGDKIAAENFGKSDIKRFFFR